MWNRGWGQEGRGSGDGGHQFSALRLRTREARAVKAVPCCTRSMGRSCSRLWPGCRLRRLSPMLVDQAPQLPLSARTAAAAAAATTETAAASSDPGLRRVAGPGAPTCASQS